MPRTAWNKGKPNPIRRRLNLIDNPVKGLKVREKISETKKRLYRTGKLIHPMLGKHHSKESRIKQSLAKLKLIEEGWKPSKSYERGNIPWNKGKRYKCPNISKAKKGVKRTTPVWSKGLTKEINDSLKKMSETKKKLWKDPKFIKKLFKSLCMKPNKAEKLLDSSIQQLTNDFKYNGDFSQGITIGGKVPDFVNCNGKKQVIEMFGEPWHNPNHRFKKEYYHYHQTYQGTIEHYKKYGYRCLIIWDYELKNSDKVIEKIRDFIQTNHQYP